MEKKEFTVDERIKFYQAELEEINATFESVEKIFAHRAKFVKARIEALEKEKTGTKEKSE